MRCSLSQTKSARYEGISLKNQVLEQKTQVCLAPLTQAEDPHVCLRQIAPGREEKSQACMVNKYMVGYGTEREKQNGSCPVERGRSEELKAVRSRLRWVARSPPAAKVMSRPELLPRAMTGLMALLPLLCVLKSMTPVTTEG